MSLQYVMSKPKGTGLGREGWGDGRFFSPPWLTCGAMCAGSSSGALAARREFRAEAKRSVMVDSTVDDGLGSFCAAFVSSPWRSNISSSSSLNMNSFENWLGFLFCERRSRR